ncbi:hypothetical protein BCR32DRAFT_291423 [Anaeromyces robustus]|uniref:Uncharacterized protein n=1 Tax=Anaeromyces robustus TaxID=1754192 RepID=A0A1Y1XFW5_9FUNG|nr:hypothetical protein BCR32DRAFT_291423 [Anaeromyces robustus]|eukprot:ORX84274.1 hypothetical protein BCR32DRAFT_291423 [Anaeromyces robustus]
MITTILLLILLIKLISFKGFLIFLAGYSLIYLLIKFINDETVKEPMYMHIHKHEIQQRYRNHTAQGTTISSSIKPFYGKEIKKEMNISGQKKKQKHDIMDISSSKTGKNKFLKSTVTIKKIIVRKTLSSTKNELIIKKSKIMKTKKIITIKNI